MDRGPDGHADKRTNWEFLESADGTVRSTKQSDDLDGDGIVDRLWLSRLTYDRGGVVLWETDDNADGSVESSVSYQYDPFGYMIGEARDDDGDGHVDQYRRYLYDAHQYRVRELQDRGSNGSEVVLIYAWEDGRLVRQIADMWADGQLDSELDSIIDLLYDTRGRLIKKTAGLPPSDDNRIAYRYNLTGWLEMSESYSSGALEGRVEYQYDAAGRRTDERSNFVGNETHIQTTWTCPASQLAVPGVQ